MDINEIKTIIINSFYENKNAHAFLLETNNLDKCYKFVKDIIKAINCPTKEENCDCNICHTIEVESNPDFVNVIADGKEIKKDQINNLLKLFNTTPIINKYSTYVISEADKLNTSSANTILKFLEEPEDNIIGFFITNKIQGIIPTIRSRCEIFKINFGVANILDYLEISEEEYNEYYDKSQELLLKLEHNKKYLLMNEIEKISELESIQLLTIVKLLRKFIEFKYNDVTKENSIDNPQIKEIIDNILINEIDLLVKRIKLLDNIIEDFKYNVNKKLILSKLILSWE